MPTIISSEAGRAGMRTLETISHVCALVLMCAAAAVGQSAAGAVDSSLVSEQANVPANRATGGVYRGGWVSAVDSIVARYFSAAQGLSSVDLVRRALESNVELAAARLNIERARARLRQAGLRPNPVITFEQGTGRFTGSPADRTTSVEFGVPIELGGKRARRIDLALAEVEAAEAEIADRERRLTSDILAAHTDALANLRELEITEKLNEIDRQMTRFVAVRVSEGETAPLELSLLNVEVERLRARREIIEGRLQAALLRLKMLSSIPLGEPLRLSENLAARPSRRLPAPLEGTIEIALRTRPDLRLARLAEEVAAAGLRLANAQATPNASIFTRFADVRSTIELPAPNASVPDDTRTLNFGVTIELPIRNRNQGARAEAAIAITQARGRREYAEQIVRAEVASAYARYAAAQAALGIYELGVIERSTVNIRTIRQAYEEGAFRITDVLAEQRRLSESQREFTDALAERLRALAALDAATGATFGFVETNKE